MVPVAWRLGKTASVRALAHDAHVHLQACSMAKWQAAGHLGDMLRAMRADFAEARRNAPAILFIDELDSVADRARVTGHNASYDTSV
ncbi:AAA family ATPase, partial [Rhodosalinus sp.]|uniref:AAA family ATPase n=1 Tax=Rhodosalinus sp. TaxID=2047741 RepID=UPI00397E6D48